MSRSSSPYDSITFGNPLSLRVDSNYLSTISIAPCGRDVVLAGRKGLLVVDLDDPFAAPRWLHHETSWEVADVQWSPHISKPSWIVSTSNQKAMVWNLERPSNDAIEYVLHGHIRAITDIHFHPQNPEMLATCSVDTFVLSWDLRCPKEPIQQWSDWRAAASQVKWNYKDSNIIASSHDNRILIWDVRKGAMPMKDLEAHDAKINGLDWSRENKYELISSSNDMSVKFWSFDKEYEKPLYTIRTDFPVAKARHVPFGDHICGIMPLRGGNDSVYMVTYKDKRGVSQLESDYIFKGHTEPVKDFIWRTRHTANTTVDDSEYQLVTWSSDRDLRLWPLNDEVYESFNYKRNLPLPPKKRLLDYEYRSYRPEPFVSTDNKLIIRHRSSRYKGSSYSETYRSSNSEFNHLNWISGIKIGQSAFQHVDNDPNSATFGDTSNQPLNLGEEVSNVGHKFPKLRFERISVSTGVLVISLNGPWSSENNDDLIFVRVEVNFPKNYPSPKAIPKFKVELTHELTLEKKQELCKNLLEISTKYCQNNKFCLEPCMRYLLGEKIDLDIEFEEELNSFDNNDDLGSISPGVSDIENEDQNEMNKDTESSDADDADDENEENEEDGEDEENQDEEEDEDEDEDGEGALHTVTDGGIIVNNQKRAPFDSTPVSKGCGAIWTPSGHLVCFFISKKTNEDRHLIKFGQQGFSLVKNPKKKHAANPTQGAFIDGTLSAYREQEGGSDSDSSSSDDSLSNDFDVFNYDKLYRRTKVPDLLRNSNLNARQFSSNDRSNILSSPTDKSQVTSNSKSMHTKNTIKIYDFSDLIPAKMELAYEYRILGDCPHVLAQYNAEVADKFGYSTIADCWRILATILVKDVIIDENNAVAILEKIGQTTDNLNIVSSYRFYWGFHPFGGVWLVRQLFNYFKKMKDIQMLAMLSCVLFENDMITDHVHVPINSPFVATREPVKGTKSILRNISNNNSPRGMHRGESIHSMIGANVGFAPPMMRNLSTVSFERKHSKSVYNYNPVSSPMQGRIPSVSTLSSFEYDNKSFKSASPAGGDAVMMMMTNSINTKMSVSNGGASVNGHSGGAGSINMVNMNNPHTHNRRGIKHQVVGLADIEHSGAYDIVSASTSNNLPGLTRSISTASLNIFNQQFGKSLPKTPTSDKDESNGSRYDDFVGVVGAPPVVNIQMLNVAELDLYENEYCVNIEGFIDPEELKIYRAEYASILFSWGLPASRLKILKFNYNTIAEKMEPELKMDNMKRKDKTKDVKEAENGDEKEKGDYTVISKKDSDFKEHHGEIGWCEDTRIEDTDSALVKWRKAHDKKKCQFCGQEVTKRLSVCTKCNHVMHEACAIIWWEDNGMRECPSGCGCKCLEKRV